MKRDCSDFEVLISAAIDGELDACESSELDRHVAGCPACRDQYRRFGQVNGWLEEREREHEQEREHERGPGQGRFPVSGQAIFPQAVSDKAGSDKAGSEKAGSENGKVILASAGRTPGAAHHHRPPKSSRRPAGIGGGQRVAPVRSRRPAVLVGGALAAAGLVALLSPGSGEISPPADQLGDLSESLNRVAVLHHETLRTQQSQTKTLALELRTLRLQAISSGGDASEIESMNHKIDELMSRIEQLGETSW